jgi:hypothetical protein
MEYPLKSPHKIPPAPARRGTLSGHFCPRCGTSGAADSTLCDACGETLVPQGYCAVCEEYWNLPPETPCPKHEVALVIPPRKAPRDPAPRPGEPWVTVAHFVDALRTEAPRIRLEAEGIPTFVEGERMGSPAMYHVATGGVKLQVPASLVTDARILLAQLWSTPDDDVDDLDLADAWDDLEPHPGAAWHDVGRALVLVVVFTPLLIFLLALWLGPR